MNLPALRRPLLAIPATLTALIGVGTVGIGIGALATNLRTFALGVAAFLIGYGVVLVFAAVLVASGRRWALGILVAAALLHLLVLYSFATAGDTAQLVGSLMVGVIVLVTLVTAVWAVGSKEFDKLG